MGILWRNIDQERVPDSSVRLKGDLKAFPKNNIFWYIQNKWKVIEVATDVPYIVYFKSSSLSMICKKIIFTKKIAVRIGQENLLFSIRNINNGELLEVVDVSRVYGLVELILSINKHTARFFKKKYVSHVTMI